MVRRITASSLLPTKRESAVQFRPDCSLVPTCKTAVCIHLFYTDRWALFARSLRSLADIPFDLFVTLPSRNRRFAATIRAGFPGAHIWVVPNRGRGTLPFIEVVRVLERYGYEAVLKLHCKKSGTAPSADRFLNIVLDRLLPGSPGLVQQMRDLLLSGEAALIGPSETYLPLDAYFTTNKRRVGVILADLCGSAVADQVTRYPAEYGFFAGSMFWARLDALAPLLCFCASDFEREFRQHDGTLAHALERLFSLLPRLQGREVYEAIQGGVRPRDSRSTGTAWWAIPKGESAR